jgi:hypothetical protein
MGTLTVKIGHLTFDNASYDEQGDVLYLQVGERQAAADGEETPEGHALGVLRSVIDHPPLSFAFDGGGHRPE